MKNRLITFAGVLTLVAVIGSFYATPAMAQYIRATLVRNVDEKGRSPYMQSQGRGCPGGGSVTCDLAFPPVPAGKRLVVERVSAVVLFANHGVRIASLLAPQDILFFFSLHPTDSTATNDPVLLVNDATLAYFESGESPTFHLVVNDSSDIPLISSTISGYLVDLEPPFGR